MRISDLLRGSCSSRKKHATDMKSLKEIAKSDPDYGFALKLSGKFMTTTLNEIVINYSNRNVKIAAVNNITDQYYLRRIARKHSSCHVRAAAIKKLNDIKALQDIAENDSNRTVKKIAFKKIKEIM